MYICACLHIGVETSRNESYVRISTMAENGLIVIQTKNITLPLFSTKRHLWHVGRQLAVVLLYTRWLPGFARVPYYAPSPCHMHPGHNCRHIKSCHPPDKQYTEYIIYTCSLFFICTALIRIHPLNFPSLAPSLPRSIPPPLASSLPPCLVPPFLARQLNQPSLPNPPFLH